MGISFSEVYDHAYLMEKIHYEAYGGSNKRL